MADDRSRQRDALALSAGELGRQALELVRQVDQLRGFGDPNGDRRAIERRARDSS